MKYYIDTEFLEGTQKEKFPINLFRKETPPTIDLISIGIVAEDGREYYAISKDFNLKEAWNRCDEKVKQTVSINGETFVKKEKFYWIRENVLKPIYDELCAKRTTYEKTYHWELAEPFSYKSMKYLIERYGKTNKQIAEEIKEFVSGSRVNIGLQSYTTKSITDNKPQFYAYYADYDWVAFCWLFGKMLDLPTGFPMYCIDLKQELDNKEQTLLNEEGNVELVSEIIPEHNCAMVAQFNSIKELPSYPKQTNEHNALADARWNKELHKFLNKL